MAFVKVGQSSIRTALVHRKSGYNAIKQRSLGPLRVRAIPLAKVYPVHLLAKQFLRIAIGNSTLPTLHTVITVPSLHGYTHLCHCKPTEAMRAHITAQSAVGIAPRFILPSLQAMTPGTSISPVDIRNIKYQQKMKELGSMTPVQALISLLERDPDWHHETQLSDDKHLISLFLVRKDMIRFARAYPELLMLDAT
jgi:hypothetical protein